MDAQFKKAAGKAARERRAARRGTSAPGARRSPDPPMHRRSRSGSSGRDSLFGSDSLTLRGFHDVGHVDAQITPKGEGQIIEASTNLTDTASSTTQRGSPKLAQDGSRESTGAFPSLGPPPHTQDIKSIPILELLQQAMELHARSNLENPNDDPNSQEPERSAAVQASSAPTKSGLSSLLGKSAKADRFITAIDGVLHCVSVLEKETSKLRDYIQSQDSADKPLYLWVKYDRYNLLNTATHNLEKAVEELEAAAKAVRVVKRCSAPRCYEVIELAVKESTGLTDTDTMVLETMKRKIATCFGEVQSSSLSDAAKAKAINDIIQEVNKLAAHTMTSKNCISAALALLLKVFSEYMADDPPQLFVGNPDHDVAQGGRDEGVQTNKRGKQTHKTRGFNLFDAFLILTGLLAITRSWNYIPGNWIANLRSFCKDDSDAIEHRLAETQNHMTDMIKTVREETENQNAMFQVKVDGLAEGLKKVEDLYNDAGLRIDHIWDTLGSPNEDGTYAWANAASPPGDIPKQNSQELIRLREKMSATVKELQEEIARLRKQMHMMDIRLTKEIKRTQRGK